MRYGQGTCDLFGFFFNDTATTEIYTLSLHDALPIFPGSGGARRHAVDRRVRDRLRRPADRARLAPAELGDRKSTRLNSSHANISYAVFCLKKKNKLKFPLQLIDPRHTL